MNKHRSLLFLAVLATSSGAFAQSNSITKLPESAISRATVEAQLRFLAADELMGRRTGSTGNMVAARYIAEQFRKLGLKTAPGQSDYYQPVPLQMVRPASYGSVSIGADSLAIGNQFVVLNGGQTNLGGETVYVGYGLNDGPDGYNGKDVKGKIVVAQVGSPDESGGAAMFSAAQRKRQLATEKGAVALVELYTNPTFPFASVGRYLSGEQISPVNPGAVTSVLPHIWVDNGKNQWAGLKDGSRQTRIRTSGRTQSMVNAVNVIGIIEGTDPKLKDEYVLLSAHFDHIGTAKKGAPNYNEADTIFNGARDNAMGTVALLSAAEALKAQPPKRSVIILAVTGEELGMIGSRYYADHPLIPLKQTIFNLNTDGAGYTDKTLISVIGLERTGAKAEIEAAAKAFGLGVFPEPAPEQNLFDRSDNVSFAAKGIPAPDLSPGFKKFDEELFKNYHQVSDNPETVDFDYLLKYSQAYTYAARLIANKTTRPKWSAGDKYEAAGKALYGY